jgi:hypothetical protein
MPDIDIILKVLEATQAAQPGSAFVQSLLLQYRQRGSLSKKQLEGLHAKAQRVKDIPSAHLATLQAIILKKHARHRSEKPAVKPLTVKDERAGQLMADILQVFPQHKRVLFLKGRYDNNETLAPAEVNELERFYKLLLKKALP